jgi:quinol-cytochrome oxidoreductase complex cytochrome b subunit
MADEGNGKTTPGNGAEKPADDREDVRKLMRASAGLPEGELVPVEVPATRGGVITKAREQGVALKDRAVKEAEGYKDPQQTQLWKSIFRVSHDRSDPRNRSLAILSNVFLHLHPAKINRDAVRYGFTWGMGGITFYLFIVLTFTGVLLMFYYHPTKVQAFRDILYLEHDVPFGRLLRNMHRWAAHLMIITTWLHMFRVVGTNMARATPLVGSEGPFGPQLGITPFNDVRFGLLGGSIVDANALLRSYIWHCIGIPLVASIFMAVHFWRIRKDGGISGPAPVMLESEMKAVKK